jgi:hypothetical protein
MVMPAALKMGLVNTGSLEIWCNGNASSLKNSLGNTGSLKKMALRKCQQPQK